MAMHLNGFVNANTIQRKSDTSLMHIHEKLSTFATSVSIKMLHSIPFRHIAGPSVTMEA
jgi:hypothetical protein